MVIYVDVLIIINFVISYFLFLASSVVSGYTYKRKNIIAASAVGAFFCLYIFVQTEKVFIDLSIKMLSLTICSVIAFGYKDRKKLVVQTVYYLLLNALLTGAIVALSLKSPAVYHNNMFFYMDINPVMLVVFSGLIYILLLMAELLKEKFSPRQKYTMDIFFADFKLVNISSFYDSGFNVRDIISNKDVIIISAEKVKDLLPDKLTKDITNFIDGKYDDVSYVFVPVMFTTLSGNGMLPALKGQYIMVENKRIDNILIAFTKDTLTENIDAIFGAGIKRQL